MSKLEKLKKILDLLYELDAETGVGDEHILDLIIRVDAEIIKLEKF